MRASSDAAVYAELAPLPRHRGGLIDHLFLLRDCGLLGTTGSKVFARPFREIRLGRVGTAQHWTLSDSPPRFHHHSRLRALHGWMLGIRCEPARCVAPVDPPAALRAAAELLTEPVRGGDLDAVVAALDSWIDELPWWPAATSMEPARAPLATGSKRVAALAGASGVSVCTLQRQLRRNNDMTPKQWLGLKRFRQALLQVAQTQEDLCEVAAARGYADQPHMNLDFRKCAGTPPGRFRALARVRVRTDPVRFFQDAGVRGRLRLLLSLEPPASDDTTQAQSPSTSPGQPPGC